MYSYTHTPSAVCAASRERWNGCCGFRFGDCSSDKCFFAAVWTPLIWNYQWYSGNFLYYNKYNREAADLLPITKSNTVFNFLLNISRPMESIYWPEVCRNKGIKQLFTKDSIFHSESIQYKVNGTDKVSGKSRDSNLWNFWYNTSPACRYSNWLSHLY